MTEDVHAILFAERLRDGGSKPLFETQADLARVIREHTAFNRKPEATVRAFLNQALKPVTDQYSRPVSTNLRAAIWQAIKTRHDPEGLVQTLERLELGLAALKDPDNYERLSNSEKEWGMLLEDAQTALHHFIYTPTPAENLSDKPADALSRILCKRLADSFEQKKFDLKYDFYIPTRSAGELLLLNIANNLAHDRAMTECDAAARVREALKRSILRVNIYAMEGFSPPTAVFEPAKQGRRSGYVLFYQDVGTVSVARMDSATLSRWYTNVYQTLELHQQLGNIERIEFPESVQRTEVTDTRDGSAAGGK